MNKRRAERRVHVECATTVGWREFKRLLVIGTDPIGRFESDGAVAVLRPDKFADLLEACEGTVFGDAQCATCPGCRT